MADDSIGGPPAKKRGATRQISKDDGSDSEEERLTASESGSFQKASDEVIASRRIVKVRRTPAIKGPSAPNPFASIRLVAPAASSDITQETANLAIPVPAAEPLQAVSRDNEGDTLEPSSADLQNEMQEKGRDTEAASAAEETCKNIDETPVVSKSLEVEEAAKNESVGGNVDVAKCKFDVESEASEPATESKELEAGDKGHGVMDVTDAEGVNNQSTDQVEKSNTFEPSVPENAGKGEEIAESMEQVEKSNAFEPSAAENAGTKEEMAASVDPKHVDDKDVAKPTLPSLGAVNSGSFSFGTAPSSFATPTAFASFSHTWASFGSGSASGTGLGSGFAFTKAASEGAFASASSAFTSNNGSSFQLFNNTFSTAPVNAGAPLQPPPSAVQFQGGNLQTGEEEEKMVFNAEATMFEFQDGAWKERGKGEVRVNVPLNKTGKARLLMRSKGNFRLILNASLFPDMKMTSMDSRGVTFACANSAVEERSGLATYALKFKDSLAAGNFRDAVDAHKSSPQDSLKTPENSPSS